MNVTKKGHIVQGSRAVTEPVVVNSIYPQWQDEVRSLSHSKKQSLYRMNGWLYYEDDTCRREMKGLKFAGSFIFDSIKSIYIQKILFG